MKTETEQAYGLVASVLWNLGAEYDAEVPYITVCGKVAELAAKSLSSEEVQLRALGEPEECELHEPSLGPGLLYDAYPTFKSTDLDPVRGLQLLHQFVLERELWDSLGDLLRFGEQSADHEYWQTAANIAAPHGTPESDRDAALVISETRKPPNSKEPGGTLPDDLMGSARLKYAADFILMIRKMGVGDRRRYYRRRWTSCEPTTHRYYVSASASLSFRQQEPPAHRFVWWRRWLLSATLWRSSAPFAPLAASERQCRWPCG
jgi:hypothetical protein